MKPRRGKPKDKTPFSQKRQALKFYRSKGKKKPGEPSQNENLEDSKIVIALTFIVFILLMIIIFIVF